MANAKTSAEELRQLSPEELANKLRESKEELFNLRFQAVMSRAVKLKAHDESNSAGIGDRVLIMETRPLSATKRWRVVEILEKAK